MGGTKNKEEKKKKAHVYSSGASGGANKGPAVIDKRNQVLDCPHCDRTFQQVQRFREHIAKKHPEEQLEEASHVPVSSSAETQTRNTMQPGSKGGYYTEKSPKLLLLEWCQQQKRPKPRYKVLAAAGNTMRCKVVLPDDKNADKDVVVFLDEAQTAGTSEEAQERGAIAALARVAGNRNMQRVLPQAFQAAWTWCVQQEEDAQARQARAAAAAESRKERDAGRRKALARKVPVTAIMSQQQRSQVEQVLAQLRDAQQVSSYGNSAGEHKVITSELQGLGFTEQDAESAINSVSHPNLAVCLDWLCLHIPEEELPLAFAPGAAGKPVSVLFAGKSAEALQDPAVAQLSGWGYPVPECVEALQRLKGSPDAAHQDLFARLSGIERTDTTDTGILEGQGNANDEWQNDVEGLTAVYEAMVSTPGTSTMLFKTAGLQEGSVVELQAWQPSSYPDDIPRIGIRCPQLSARQLLFLTQQLAGVAKQEAGQSMLHMIVAALADMLEDLPVEPPYPTIAPPPGARQATADSASLVSAIAPAVSHVGDAIQRSQRSGNRRVPSVRAQQAESKQLQQQQEALLVQAAHASMRQARQKLPAFTKHKDLLTKLSQHSVIVISGATGCGKSTQVPQYILEDAIAAGSGAACNIICTQPRRISAVGVSTRVAQERGEGVGSVVGYSVRLESRTSQRTRLLFCTTGVLLRRFLGDPGLEGISHVVIDEVHERSVDTDLSLLLLRDLLNQGSPIKVILMSATANAELFASYFSNQGKQKVAMLSIPGLAHPVRDLYLEDVLERTNFIIGRGSKSWEETSSAYSPSTLKSLELVDENQVNYDLVEALVVHIVDTESAQGPGSLLRDWPDAPDMVSASQECKAILIFMPGAPEIARLVRQLESSPCIRQASQGRCKVLPLHGALPSHAQVRVFERLPAGVRKVVVATNVAETSITIDDVGFVIDSGRVKEMNYDSERGISRLAEGWVSLAAAQQRRGRAGRVQPGVCFKLFSHKQAAQMQDQQPPEVCRTPLQQLCLTVKTRFGDNHKLLDVLSHMLTPPPSSAIMSSVDSLSSLGALDGDEALTALGRLLSQIPMDPRLAKTCIFACMLRCVSPVLIVVAAMTHGRSVFVSPPDKRAEAAAARAQITANSTAAKSDHLAIIAAFNGWTAAWTKGGRQQAHTNFLSESALEAIEAGRAEFAATLMDMGLLPPSFCGWMQQQARSSLSSADNTLHEFDSYCNNARIVKAALCAGYYPSILRVEHPAARYQGVQGGSVEIDAKPAELRFYDKHKGRVFIHPGSVNFDVGKFDSGWLVYTEMVATAKLYVRESSLVPVYALLLFGGQISVQHEEGTLKLDGWATFKAPARIAVLIRELRQQVDKLLLEKVASPTLSIFDSPITAVMQDLLAKDGF
ncbi:MAG: putative ATP-dependent RNA helicase DHX57 [Trebouxia sp. A1-2]|nr:MAG: putative ATP-dependent RNA helicase DHX57 [Trebouxia sp. A1-2]